MSKIKNYKEFINDIGSTRLDSKTLSFINSDISESQFLEYLQTELVNESLITNIRKKILDVLFTFLTKAKDIGFAILDKLKSVFNWIIEAVTKFKKKNPIVYKVIIITIIIIILLIISASSAQAAITGTPTSLETINTAIGFLEKLRYEEVVDSLDSAKAITHLIDLRDGKIDIPQIGDVAIEMAQAAIRTVEKMVSDAVSKNDENLMNTCIDFMERGSDLVKGIYTKVGSTEEVKLVFK